MKRKLFLIVLSVMLLSACAAENKDSQTTVSTEKSKPKMITGENYDEYGGADAYDNSGDHPDSKYYVNPDFYNMESDEQITIIPKFKTIQQTTEWSCGNAATLMVLNHFGKADLTEMDLAVGMNSSVDIDTPGALPGTANNFCEYGTDVARMYQFLSNMDDIEVVETSYIENPTPDQLISPEDGTSEADIGNIKPTFSGMSLYASENSDDTESYVEDAKDSYFVQWLTGHLKAGRPIMVEWGDWDGHWVSIIGYDNMGTPSLGDDILIFADPYDTSDHWQDGYYYYPVERWFYMWKDRNVAPKPYQLQPYIIIDKVE